MYHRSFSIAGFIFNLLVHLEPKHQGHFQRVFPSLVNRISFQYLLNTTRQVCTISTFIFVVLELSCKPLNPQISTFKTFTQHHVGIALFTKSTLKLKLTQNSSHFILLVNSLLIFYKYYDVSENVAKQIKSYRFYLKPTSGLTGAKMPSDYQKKKLAKKKEAAKQKGGKKAAVANGKPEENGAENSENEQLVNGAGSVNGTKENSSEKTTYEGKTMAIS